MGRTRGVKRKGNGDVSLPVAETSHDCASGARPEVKKSRAGYWRAGVLIAVHVAIAAHVVKWLLLGSTLSPVEPSESMETLETGAVNMGFIFFVVALLSTVIFGRYFCGWGCHVVALQDLCHWMMGKIGLRPKPFRSRLLLYAPLGFALYMFVWPTFKRNVLGPVLIESGVGVPSWLVIGEPIDRFESALFVEDFWATFPEWYIAAPFLFVCGFAAVYFLGSKGFCTYGCPYGGFFAPVDRAAPVRIRVTDACAQCGHCTAACTSNVRVHEEVHDFGMVVDPGCMKCMDCVSVCPNDALYVGWGRPAVGAKPLKGREESARVSKAKRERRYDLTRKQEVVIALVFVASFMSWRGMADQIPLLMAAGMAGVTAFLAHLFWTMVSTPNARVYGIKLRFKGRFSLAGVGFGLVFLGMTAVLVWGGMARWSRWRGDIGYLSFEAPFVSLLRPEFAASSDELARAESALVSYAAADSVEEGGHGWRLDPDRLVRVAYLEATAGQPDLALEALRRVILEGRPTDGLINQIGSLARSAGMGRETLIEIDRLALETHPALHAVRGRLASLAVSEGDQAGGEAMWAVEDEDVRGPGFDLEHARWLVSRGRVDEAAPKLEAAADVWLEDRFPNPPRAVEAGVVLLVIGRMDAGLGVLERAANHPRADVGVMLSAAQPALRVGRRDKAEAWVEMALEAPGGRRPGPRARAAAILADLGEVDRAAGMIGESIDEYTRLGRGWDLSALGGQSVQLGMRFQHRELVLQGLDAMRAGSEMAGAGLLWSDLAGALATTGDMDGAADAMVRAAEASDRSVLLAERAGQVLGQLGREDEAARWREEAARRGG